jgi:thymidine kinase
MHLHLPVLFWLRPERLVRAVPYTGGAVGAPSIQRRHGVQIQMAYGVGSIEVICGSMFSGKTDELIRRLVRAQIARQKVQVFKPAVDMRFAATKVISHAGADLDAVPVDRAAEILHTIEPETTVVGIDEAQFMDAEVVDVVQTLVAQGRRVLVAGLDMDFRGEPFGVMPVLMSKAERVDKLHAICMICGGEASRSQRLLNGKPARYDEPIVIVGASELYEARCRTHHEVPR